MLGADRPSSQRPGCHRITAPRQGHTISVGHLFLPRHGLRRAVADLPASIRGCEKRSWQLNRGRRLLHRAWTAGQWWTRYYPRRMRHDLGATASGVAAPCSRSAVGCGCTVVSVRGGPLGRLWFASRPMSRSQNRGSLSFCSSRLFPRCSWRQGDCLRSPGPAHRSRRHARGGRGERYEHGLRP